MFELFYICLGCCNGKLEEEDEEEKRTAEVDEESVRRVVEKKKKRKEEEGKKSAVGKSTTKPSEPWKPLSGNKHGWKPIDLGSKII